MRTVLEMSRSMAKNQTMIRKFYMRASNQSPRRRRRDESSLGGSASSTYRNLILTFEYDRDVAAVDNRHGHEFLTEITYYFDVVCQTNLSCVKFWPACERGYFSASFRSPTINYPMIFSRPMFQQDNFSPDICLTRRSSGAIPR